MPALPWRSFANLPSEAEALAMASRLPLTSYRAIPAFLRDTKRVRQQLETADGLLGYSLTARVSSKTFLTLSAWRDEAALQAFAYAFPHSEVMKSLRGRMGTTTFVTWTIRGADLPLGWRDAYEHLVG